MISREYN